MEEIQDCTVKLRINPRRQRDKVYVGCGAGFGGDRTLAALKLLRRVKELNYLVLECLAERTLADRYQIMASGGKGYDPRVKEWMSVLLPMALERKVCIITNMGAMDPLGAQKEVLDVASSLGLEITVAVAYELSTNPQGTALLSGESTGLAGGRSTYLGAASIVHCLENYNPHVVITSRVADAALFLAPMVYELGWNWNDTEELAHGTLASHLLECGCQLTGGYFMHPGDAYRDFSYEQLLDMSLPYAEVSYEGDVYVGKADGSGGLLSHSTCAEQLLYEVGDPGNYITPDLVVDFRNVRFHQMSEDRVQCRGAKPSNACRPEKLLQLCPTEFSGLSPVIPWEVDDIWRIYAGYFFILHVPLSFGGLDVVAKLLHCSSLNPMTTVISTVILQLTELTLALALLQYAAVSGHDVQSYFVGKFSMQQNWILPEDAYYHTLKNILTDSPTSKLLCFFLYCVVAPLSEETIYRGFLLTALSSSMKMQDAILISSLVFSIAHLSGASFIQLFVIGCITGLTYCRTGTLVSSFSIHSLYNAAILYMALMS